MSARPRPGVTALVVTYRAADTIEACLGSVPRDVGVVVVDNASGDDTVALARAARPDAVVIEGELNQGFAVGVNVGLDAVPDDHDVLLLNPDAVLGPDALEALGAALHDDDGVGAVSARVVDHDGRAERCCGHAPDALAVTLHELGLGRVAPRRSLYATPPADRRSEWDWVAGTCVLVARRCLDDVGPLDVSYFLYAEDLDWCGRARTRGWRLLVEPAAVCVHGGSVAVNQAGAWVDQHRHGSLDRHLARTLSRNQLAVARAARVVGPLLRGVVQMVLGVVLREPARRALARRRFLDARQLRELSAVPTADPPPEEPSR